MKKVFGVIFTLVLSCAIFAGCGQAETNSADEGESSTNQETVSSTDVISLTCATKMTADSFEGKTFQHFADLVNEYTNGTVEIVIYPSEQLGDSLTVVNNMQLGTIDMYIEGPAYFSGYGVDCDYSGFPFLFSSYGELQEMITGDFGAMQMEQMENAGFKMLCSDRSWQRGPYYVTCSTTPLSTMEDLTKIILRSADTPVFMSAMAFLGVQTVVVNYSECYMALQNGMVGAVNCPISNVESMAFWEVAPYVAYMNCYPQEIWPVMNLDKFNSLSEDQQMAIIKAANETAAYSNAELETFTNDMIGRLEEQGVVFNMDYDNTTFVDALRPFYQEMATKGELSNDVASAIGLI